jgi:hypothetical protein
MFLYTACYMIKYSCDSPLIGTLAKVGNFSKVISKSSIFITDHSNLMNGSIAGKNTISLLLKRKSK